MMIDEQSVNYFHTSDVTLAYVEGPPNGLPLLLIHGTGSRWQPFRSILPALVEKYHVYAIDLRGHGQSSHMPGAYHLASYARDVHQFITDHVQRPVIIYGHSLGALVAIKLADSEPQSVSALILGDPPLYSWNTPTEETFWKEAFTDLLNFMLAYPDPEKMNNWLVQNMPNMSSERREERAESLRTLDPDVIRAVITDDLTKGISLEQLVRNVACPVLLLKGNQKLGSALREQDVEFATTRFSNIHVLEMETIGHGIIPPSQLPQMIEFINREIKR